MQVIMTEVLNRTHLWQEAAPVIDEQALSYWEKIPVSYLKNPWRAWLRFTGGHTGDMLGADPVSVGYIQDQPDGELERDKKFEDYRKKFGWGDEGRLDAPMCQYTDFIREDARQILEFCRASTFPSFARLPLGITLEFSVKYWMPKEQTNPFDHDVVPHQDWVRQDIPVAIVLSSAAYDPEDIDVKPNRQYNTNLWNGRYTYKGDLVDHRGQTTSYLDAVTNLGLAGDDFTESRNFWVADARRGLHGRPTMQPDDRPVIRLFMRGFVAPAGRD